jgi:hypothetical protein
MPKRKKLIQDTDSESKTSEEASWKECKIMVPFSQIVSEGSIMPSSVCWGCKYHFAKPMLPGQDPVMDKLWSIWENNVDLSVPKRAALIAMEHERSVYIPAIRKGKEDALAWPYETIMYHLSSCRNEWKVDLELDYRDFKILCQKLKNYCIEKVGSDEAPANQTIDRLIRLTDQKYKIGKMLFGVGLESHSNV